MPDFFAVEASLLEKGGKQKHEESSYRKVCRRYMRKAQVTYALLSSLFLIMGMCIYLLFRDISNIILFAWMPKPEFLENITIHLPPSIFSNVLRHNLAGMFWFVSGILFFRFVWFHRAKAQRAYIWGFYGMGAILEIGQLSEKIPGTFDSLDLLFIGIGAFVEGLLYNFFVERRIA